MAYIKEAFLAGHENYMRMKILLALESLLKDSSLKKLSVADICRTAGISRPTFYKNFIDKYKVIQWYWDKAYDISLIGTEDIPDWRARYRIQLVNMLELMSEESILFLGAFKAEDYSAVLYHDSITDYGYRRRVGFIENMITEKTHSSITDGQRFAIRFFVTGEANIIASWFNTGMTMPVEQLAEQILNCFPQELSSIMDRA